MMTKIRFALLLVWNGCRYPRTRKQGWVMVSAWTIALFLPLVSILISPNGRGLDFTIWVGWSNVICIVLDIYMLSIAIEGLLWRYSLPRQGRRRKTDTLAK